MKKIDIKKIVIYVLVIICICFLKKNYIYSICNSDGTSLIKILLVYWSDNQLVNIIWFLPLLFGIFIILKKYFYKLNYFDLRFRNRKKYINNVLISLGIESFLIVLLTALCQLVIIFFLIPNIFNINFSDFLFLLNYTTENVFLIIEIMLIALITKKLMYSLIFVIIVNFITLVLTINLSLLSSQIYLPFINVYLGNNNSVVTILIILIELMIIKKIYLHYDIGGME